ncbi:hypothetical protein ONS95_006454 [Cadophora gregata]|uniref:uncharacterized protein n=1 Tax=Cadophora gregata TaxID=51156 RepID=UPI0026DC50CC|nr:uncharacterized protein ONS95_006454 [Cadophora gregata]KAK0101275.1 hypothetical protein ONS95_006454 [Cadophora gregata]
MGSVDPPTLPGSRRSRAPTITIDTTASEQTVIENHVETRETLSELSSFESRPTSPHNVSCPGVCGNSGGFLAVPGARTRARQNSIENEDTYKHESCYTVTETALDEDAQSPDPGSEKDFQVNDNAFAFSPGQLNKLFNPKSLSAFYALRGLSGLEKGLRTDRCAGLDIHSSQSIYQTEPGGRDAMHAASSSPSPLNGLTRSTAPSSRYATQSIEKFNEADTAHLVPYTGSGRVTPGTGNGNGDFFCPMGITGTKVTKDAASDILKDDSLGSIVKDWIWGIAAHNAVKEILSFIYAEYLIPVVDWRLTFLNLVLLSCNCESKFALVILVLAKKLLAVTDSEIESKSYQLRFAKRSCTPPSARHKALQLQQTPNLSQRLFVAFGGLALSLPVVAATSDEWPSSNWMKPTLSSTAAITTSKAVATTQPSIGRESPLREDWVRSLAPLYDILWTIAITVVAFAIFRWFCGSRSRRIDKARKYCFFWMVVFQALFFLIRDDPDSPPGFLFGLFIGSGLFTYKSAARGAARFGFGLFYALAGIVMGVIISIITLPFIRTKSGNPSWETILFPSISVAFAALEIGSQCFLANMNYRDEDEINDEAGSGKGLPMYRYPHSRSTPSPQSTWLERTHQWQESQISRACSIRLGREPNGLEYHGTYPQVQGISHSVDLPHPESFVSADDDYRPAGS